MHCVYPFTPPTSHENVIWGTPDPPFVSGGAGKPDYRIWCWQTFCVCSNLSYLLWISLLVYIHLPHMHNSSPSNYPHDKWSWGYSAVCYINSRTIFSTSLKWLKTCWWAMCELQWHWKMQSVGKYIRTSYMNVYWPALIFSLKKTRRWQGFQPVSSWY